MDDDWLADERLIQKFLASIKLNSQQQQIDHHSKILELIKTLVLNKKTVREFDDLLKLSGFSQLQKLLCKDDHKFEASKWILETMKANFKYNNRHETIIIEDRETINHLLELFVTVNDSLNLLTSDDDIEHLSSIITYFLDKVLIQDHIAYLEFLVQCRASLSNLNPIFEYLVNRALGLASESNHAEKKRTSRQNFFNSCLAFNLITIPAINKPSKRIDLYVRACRSAFEQMSLFLADCYLKQALIDLSEQLNPPHVDIVGGTSTKQREPKEINETHLPQTRALIELLLSFEDHVDLRHKLALRKLVKHNFDEHSNLIERMNLMNTIDDNYAESDSITTS